MPIWNEDGTSDVGAFRAQSRQTDRIGKDSLEDHSQESGCFIFSDLQPAAACRLPDYADSNPLGLLFRRFGAESPRCLSFAFGIILSLLWNGSKARKGEDRYAERVFARG